MHPARSGLRRPHPRRVRPERPTAEQMVGGLCSHVGQRGNDDNVYDQREPHARRPAPEDAGATTSWTTLWIPRAWGSRLHFAALILAAALLVAAVVLLGSHRAPLGTGLGDPGTVLTLWFAGTLMVVTFQDSETDATRSSSAFGCSSPHRARQPCDVHDAPTGRSGPGATPDDRPLHRADPARRRRPHVRWHLPRPHHVASPATDDSGMTARSSDTR